MAEYRRYPPRLDWRFLLSVLVGALLAVGLFALYLHL